MLLLESSERRLNISKACSVDGARERSPREVDRLSDTKFLDTLAVNHGCRDITCGKAVEPSARLARTSGAAVACRQRPPSIQEAYVYIMSVGELVAPRAALQAVLAINLLGPSTAARAHGDSF